MNRPYIQVYDLDDNAWIVVFVDSIFSYSEGYIYTSLGQPLHVDMTISEIKKAIDKVC